MADNGVTKPCVSFSFSKQVAKKLQSSKLRDESTREVEEETDFVKSFEDKQINSSIKKEEKKELVIPLIHANKWRMKENSELGGRQEKEEEEKKKKPKEERNMDEGNVRNLEEQAAQEIMEETQKADVDWESRGEKKGPEIVIAVPSVMQNQVPDGYETDEKMDVSLRAEQATLEDYENVPIEEYGLAMLRGMGWNQNTGIGGKNKQVVTPVEPTLRPKGLGLGAESRALQGKKTLKGEDEQLIMAVGAYVCIEEGSHRGLYGEIQGLDDENARLIIKLTLSGATVTIGEYRVRVVSKKEYKNCSKVINKEKYEKYNEEQKTERKEKKYSDESYGESRKSQSKGNETDSSGKEETVDKYSKHGHKTDKKDINRDSCEYRKEKQSKYKEREDHEERDFKSKYRGKKEMEEQHEAKKMKYSYDRVYPQTSGTGSRDVSGKDKSRNNEEKKTPQWVCPLLRVRCIDCHFKHGKYYNTKLVVIDVISADTCICRAEDGRLLEDVQTSMLETVIPKSDLAPVMVVLGKYKGQIGQVLKRDKSNYVATVQLIEDKNVVELDYDQVCDYTGEVS